MIDQEMLWRQFSALPPAARDEMTDFLAFLHAKYTTPSLLRQPAPPLTHEPFLGIWQDREDMQDATTWVRTFRSQEWS